MYNPTEDGKNDRAKLHLAISKDGKNWTNIYELENQAEAAGGMVHFVLGNHEEMNLSGDFRYVRNKYMNVAKKMNCDYADLYSSKTELGTK